MCGIVAYVGHRQAHQVIIKGLKRLEYRGYDSAGIALLNGGLNIYKKKGKVAELEAFIKDRKSTRLNSSHQIISYAVFCLKKKKLHICLPTLCVSVNAHQ